MQTRPDEEEEGEKEDHEEDEDEEGCGVMCSVCSQRGGGPRGGGLQEQLPGLWSGGG